MNYVNHKLTPVKDEEGPLEKLFSGYSHCPLQKQDTLQQIQKFEILTTDILRNSKI